MARKTSKSRQGFIWIPPDRSSPQVKVILTDKDGVDHVIIDTTPSSNILDKKTLNCTLLRETRKLARFDIELINDSGEYLNVFEAGNKIEIYSDYDDCSTKIFTGKIDEIKYNLNEQNGYTINITGKDYPECSGLKVIEQFYNPDTVWTGLQTIITNYLPEVSITYWENEEWTSSPSDSFEYLNKNYDGETVEEVIEDMCNIGNLEAYFEYDNGWFLRVFKSENIIDYNNAVQNGINLKSVSDFGKDYDSYFNSIRLIGKIEADNIVLIRTKETDPEPGLWKKEYWETDSNLDSMDLIDAKATYLLNEKSNFSYNGFLTTIGLPTLKAGVMIPVSVPYCGINGNFKVTRVTHNFTSGFTTSIEINRTTKQLKDFFNELRSIQRGLSPNVNLNNMKNSFVVYFDESPSICNHNNTEESNGLLKLQSGASTGTMTTDVYTTDEEFTQVELRIYSNFPNTEQDTYEISNDGGATWTTVQPGSVTTLPTSGNKLVLKVNMTTNGGTLNPAYESIAVLYK